MNYLTRPVSYLDTNDFDENGIITNKDINTNLPVFIMIQALWCPHCTHAKPHFQKFAENNKNKVICCSIQADANIPAVKEFFNNKLKNMCPNFQGFPTYIVQHKGQNIEYENGRKTEDLQSYLDSL